MEHADPAAPSLSLCGRGSQCVVSVVLLTEFGRYNVVRTRSNIPVEQANVAGEVRAITHEITFTGDV